MHARLLFSLFFLGWMLFYAASAAAQRIDVTGTWSTEAAIYGRMGMTLQQNGTSVTGTYNTGGLPGQIRGTLQDNRLVGTYQDISSSGTIEFTFSPDGNQFRGYYARSGPNASGRLEWIGTRTSQSAETPEDILAQRARLAEALSSGLPPERQASVACDNLFRGTYVQDSNGFWVTSITVRNSPFAPVLGAPAQAKVLVAVTDMRMLPPDAARLSQADRLNGFRYMGEVRFQGTSYARWQEGSRPVWQSLNGNTFFTCKYILRDERAQISATEIITGTPAERLARP